MRSRSLLLVTAIFAVTACSGSDDSGSVTTPPIATTDTAGTTVAADDVESTEVPPTEVPVSDTVPATEPAPTTTEPPAEAFFGDFDVVIVQATDESGGGTRPLLEWAEVVGADHYAAYVYAPTGDTYWAWRGSETSVYVGGATQIREDAPGPSITDGMSWAVVAYDADLLPIAASAMRPISP